GLLRTRTDPTGATWTYLYDALARPVGTVDPRTGTNTIAYAADGRVAWQEDAAGSRTAYGYDPETGRRIAVTDALSNVVHTAYDLQGRVTNTWGATYPVGYEYDALGRMTAMHTWRDENGAPDTTRWNYDPATGLLTNKVYADGLGPSYAYDPAGRLAKRTWARGVETDYSYDALGQLAAIDYSDDTPDVTFTYDRQGRQLTVTDILGTRTNVYDALNLLEERYPDGDALVRTYDAYGRAAGIALGTDYAVGYGYDEYGRFSTVAVSNGPTFTYSYVPDSSLLAGYTNDLGLAVAYEYEPHRDVKTLVSNAWGTNVLSTFAYTYDALGRRTQRIDDATTTNFFGYNLRSELVSAEMGTNTYAYAYDPIGNRLSSTENGLTTTYAANALNQYTALNPASTNPTPFTYDPDGNMTYDGTWSYAWDAENRLIEVHPLATNLDSTLLQFMYDAQSRRIARREFSWMAFLHDEPTWRYVQGCAYRYDGWNLLHELKPHATPRTPPTYIPQTNLYLTGATGPVAAGYVWGLDLSATPHGAGGVGGLLQVTRNGTNAFSFYDANGNTTTTTDYSGNILDVHEYEGFGHEIGEQSGYSEIPPFRFRTRFQECQIGVLYYGFRYYSTLLGRWLARDRLGVRGDINTYAYANNSPCSSIDIHGNLTIREEELVKEINSNIQGPHGAGGYESGEQLECSCTGEENESKFITCFMTLRPKIVLTAEDDAYSFLNDRVSNEQHERNHHTVFLNVYLPSYEHLIAEYEYDKCCNCEERLEELLKAFSELKDELRKWEIHEEYSKVPRKEPALDYGASRTVKILKDRNPLPCKEMKK
ncbi:MAG: RHS repeat protein, partial [Kiritimatiellae bacterium]|nr:RHS repeat protein [Kiritimatiellia bacterium]